MQLRRTVGEWVESVRFQRVVTVLIVISGITLGLETSDRVMASVGPYLLAFDLIVLSIFVFEIAGKLFYRGASFFRNGWNVFDFLVVGIALLPASGPLAVLRALRILRILRLLSVVPALRRVVEALLRSVPGLVSVIAIIMLFFYVGAVLATKLFGDAFEPWFGTIGQSMYTLFQIMTLESWSMGIVRPVMEIYPLAWLFFVPFIVVTSFAVLNLFIGIIVDSMQMLHAEERADDEKEALERGEEPTTVTPAEMRSLAKNVAALRSEIADLKSQLPAKSNS